MKALASAIAKMFRPGAGASTAKTVAVIDDKYFFYENVELPSASIKNSEIRSMVELTVNSITTGCGDEIVSGFFVDSGGSTLSIFAAYKVRLLKEMPVLAKCHFWIPDKFFRDRICENSPLKPGDGFATVEVDGNGVLSMEGKTMALFSKDFWNAELHCEEDKLVNRLTNLANAVLGKIVTPVASVTSIVILVSAVALSGSYALSARKSSLDGKKPVEAQIVKMEKLRDELRSFSDGAIACLRHLDTVNSVRPKGIVFSEFHAPTPKVISFSGISDSVATFNAFVEILQKNESIADVSLSSVVSTKDRTTFVATVTFP